MPISDATLRGRAPRLGTITLGRTMAYDKNGKQGKRPTKTERPVFHTDDKDLALALVDKYGGEIFTESDEWACDVVIAESSFECFALPALYSAWLEQWKTATCVRRCDGEQMVQDEGQRLPVSIPCKCEAAMAEDENAERACKPHTIFPVLVELDADRYAPWDVRATSWSSASMIKGGVDSMVAAGLGTSIVPITLGAKEVMVRDPKGGLQKAYEFTVQVNVALRSLPAFQGVMELGGQSVAALPSGGVDEAIGALAVATSQEAAVAAWKAILAAASADEVVVLREAWKEKFGVGHDLDAMTPDDWSAWITVVRSIV